MSDAEQYVEDTSRRIMELEEQVSQLQKTCLRQEAELDHFRTDNVEAFAYEQFLMGWAACQEDTRRVMSERQTPRAFAAYQAIQAAQKAEKDRIRAEMGADAPEPPPGGSKAATAVVGPLTGEVQHVIPVLEPMTIHQTPEGTAGMGKRA